MGKLTIYKAGELGKRLDVHPNTIRNWADEYSELMSAGAQGKAPQAKRRFTYDDALILATIADYRNNGITPDKIKQALIEGKRVATLPELATEEEEEARQGIALVPLPKLEHELERVKMLEEQLQQAQADRDAALTQWQGILTERDEKIQSLNKHIAELEGKLGHAQGRLEALELGHEKNARYTLYLIGAVIAIGIVIGALIIAAALVIGTP